jgi:hypothetical protein
MNDTTQEEHHFLPPLSMISQFCNKTSLHPKSTNDEKENQHPPKSQLPPNPKQQGTVGAKKLCSHRVSVFAGFVHVGL